MLQLFVELNSYFNFKIIIIILIIIINVIIILQLLTFLILLKFHYPIVRKTIFFLIFISSSFLYNKLINKFKNLFNIF